MERDGRLHSLRSRSPTPPPYHPSADTAAYDALNASGVTMGPYYCFFRGGGLRAAQWIRTYGTQAKKGSAIREATETFGPVRWECP